MDLSIIATAPHAPRTACTAGCRFAAACLCGDHAEMEITARHPPPIYSMRERERRQHGSAAFVCVGCYHLLILMDRTALDRILTRCLPNWKKVLVEARAHDAAARLAGHEAADP